MEKGFTVSILIPVTGPMQKTGKRLIMLSPLIKPLIASTSGIIILWIITRLLFSKNYEKYFPAWKKEILFVFFTIYMGCMFCITLYPTPMMFYKTSGSGSINLTPFITTIHEFIKAFSLPEIYAGPFLKYLLITIIGNLVLFVPFGFFVPQLSKFKTFTKLMLAALVLSTGIEIIQYFLHFIGIYRSVDVDDIILNVTGAAVGFFILLAYRKIQNV